MVTRYEEDFKNSIVETVKADLRPDELDEEYGPSIDSIQNQVTNYSPVEINGESISADELKKLRKELAILKRAAVFLATHQFCALEVLFCQLSTRIWHRDTSNARYECFENPDVNLLRLAPLGAERTINTTQQIENYR